MKDLKQFTNTELEYFKTFTEILADGNQERIDFAAMSADDEPDSVAENQARAYAARRNKNKTVRRADPFGSDNDLEIVAGVRDWLRRQRGQK